MTREIRRFRIEDAPVLVALRREALNAEPLAFAASSDNDSALELGSVERFLGENEIHAVHGAFDGVRAIGMIGLVRAAKRKQRHKATLWGFYVDTASRGKGIGGALLDRAIEQARAWGVDELQLSVSDPATAARRLYEYRGFVEWGREPRALYSNGRFVEEAHRGKSFGRALLRFAERDAAEQRYDVVYLSTFSFQAPGFYAREGYTMIGELRDCPRGAKRHWYAKQLEGRVNA